MSSIASATEIRNQITAANNQAANLMSELQGTEIDSGLVTKIAEQFCCFSNAIAALQKTWEKTEADMKMVCEWGDKDRLKIKELTDENLQLKRANESLQTLSAGKDTTIQELRGRLTLLETPNCRQS